MSKDINLADPGIWDDSALIKSWNEALQEYNKYHSIHAQGKSLEEVLTDEELAQLKMERRAQRKGHHELPPETQDDQNVEMEISTQRETVETVAPQPTIKEHATSSSEPNGVSESAGSAPLAKPQMPLALLNGVQDESLRNLMMSWYYAGYYTGYHEGQQKAQAELNGSKGG